MITIEEARREAREEVIKMILPFIDSRIEMFSKHIDEQEYDIDRYKKDDDANMVQFLEIGLSNSKSRKSEATLIRKFIEENIKGGQ